MESTTFERQSAIQMLRSTMENQQYRPDVKAFAEYQSLHYGWVQSSADVYTDQPAIVQLVSCLLDDPALREEYRRIQDELERLCEVADRCDERRSLASVRQQMLGGRRMRAFEDGSIGLETESQPLRPTLDVGEPPPLPPMQGA